MDEKAINSPFKCTCSPFAAPLVSMSTKPSNIITPGRRREHIPGSSPSSFPVTASDGNQTLTACGRADAGRAKTDESSFRTDHVVLNGMAILKMVYCVVVKVSRMDGDGGQSLNFPLLNTD